MSVQSELVWQDNPEGEKHLWLRDNLKLLNQVDEFIQDTQEFKQSSNAIDRAINGSAWNSFEKCIDCQGSFDRWLCSNGGCYIQDDKAREVLMQALVKKLEESGYTVGPYRGKPVAIFKTES